MQCHSGWRLLFSRFTHRHPSPRYRNDLFGVEMIRELFDLFFISQSFPKATLAKPPINDVKLSSSSRGSKLDFIFYDLEHIR
jgi:hypothetical protein